MYLHRLKLYNFRALYTYEIYINFDFIIYLTENWKTGKIVSNWCQIDITMLKLTLRPKATVKLLMVRSLIKRIISTPDM